MEVWVISVLILMHHSFVPTAPTPPPKPTGKAGEGGGGGVGLMCGAMTFWMSGVVISRKNSRDNLVLSQRTMKPTKWHVRPVKTQFSLGIRPVWSVFAGRKLVSLATYGAHSEDWSD